MLAAFLESLFDDGNIEFRAAPPDVPHDVEAADRLLTRAFADYRLEVAGPLLEIDLPTARTAAVFVQWACWFLVHRDSPEADVARRLRGPAASLAPAAHLSADLTFRHLAQLHRRARILSPDDVLTRRILEALRAWPLSGVLADVDDPPTTPPDFAGHRGLQLLYAERYVGSPRESWLPEGPIRDYVELLGQRTPAERR